MPLHFAARVSCSLALTLTLGSAIAGSINVTDTGASTPQTCTLAQAIRAANLANNADDATPAGATTIAPLSASATIDSGICAGAVAGANTIELPAGVTIAFASDAPDNFWYGPNALPPIASTITIDGHGATLAVTTGTSPRLRFFFVGADPAAAGPTPGYNTPGAGHLTLHNLTLAGGRQKGGDGGLLGGGGAGLGGAIFNQGVLTLDAVTMLDNVATGGGDGTFASQAGGGLGADANNLAGAGSAGGGMGGSVPNGTSENGGGAGSIIEGGQGGGIDNGTGGNGGGSQGIAHGPGSYGLAGNGAGAGGGSGSVGGGGGAGFGGGVGGSDGASIYSVGGAFGGGGASMPPGGGFAGYGGGGGVGGGGGAGLNEPGGGGFGGGGGAKISGSLGGGGGGGFGGGAGSGPNPTVNEGGGFGGGNAGAIGMGGAGAGMGGAIFNHFGTLVLLNCTLTGNSARGGSINHSGNDGGSGYGGAIFNLNGSVTVSFSTLAANTVVAGTGKAIVGVDGNADGGAIYSLAYNADAQSGSVAAGLAIANSILATSVGGSDLAVGQPISVGTPANLLVSAPSRLTNAATATVIAAGHNLVMSAVVSSDAASPPTLPAFETNADPLLAAPAANGATDAPYTMQPLAASPVFDAATCEDAFAQTISVDERGFARPAARCDLGAYNGDHIFIDGFD